MQHDDHLPPVVLTFLAPAERCNQRCPNCYITEVVDEPVRSFELSPADYARFFDQFVEAGIPILSTKFQGYEVTLPRSWPYLEAVFQRAQALGVRRTFITNGMLLSRWTKRIRALGVSRLSVSLDGASAEINDRFRGLVGAFAATAKSLARFLDEAPEYADRVAVASVLRDEDGDSFCSLVNMPRLLRTLGVGHWVLSVEYGIADDRIKPLIDPGPLLKRLETLQRSAEAEGIRFHASDEYGALTHRRTTRCRSTPSPRPSSSTEWTPLVIFMWDDASSSNVRSANCRGGAPPAAPHPRW